MNGCRICEAPRHYIEYQPGAWLCMSCAELVYGGHPANTHTNEDLV